MSKRKKYNAVVVTGQYEDRETGKSRNRYLTVGVVLEDSENGELSMKLEAVPVNFSGWINFWEPKDQTGAAPSAAPAAKSDDEFGDSVPF